MADFLVLMAYDQHTPLTPPGPVAGYDWVKAALDYAVRRVPPSKLLLGLPLYGREWVETAGGTTAHSLAYKDLKQFLEDPASERHWDDLSRTTWFQLREGETLRTAWFDDARSLREKLKLVQLYHLRGYAAWRLGVEDRSFGSRKGSDEDDQTLHSLFRVTFPGRSHANPAVVGLSVLMFTALAAGARGAEHTWVVYSAGELDERIERQLNVLAVQDQALIRILKSAAERSRVVPEAGGLTIELRQEKSVEAFLDALKREAGATAIAPTAELAQEGYIIEANYPRAAVPNRLRITAATWRGFHNALLRVPDLLAIAPSNLSSELIPHPQAVRIEREWHLRRHRGFPLFPGARRGGRFLRHSLDASGPRRHSAF